MINYETTDRSIKDHNSVYAGSMTSEVKKWWKGLGRELEVDIESFDE